MPSCTNVSWARTGPSKTQPRLFAVPNTPHSCTASCTRMSQACHRTAGVHQKTWDYSCRRPRHTCSAGDRTRPRAERAGGRGRPAPRLPVLSWCLGVPRLRDQPGELVPHRGFPAHLTACTESGSMISASSSRWWSSAGARTRSTPSSLVQSRNYSSMGTPCALASNVRPVPYARRSSVPRHDGSPDERVLVNKIPCCDTLQQQRTAHATEPERRRTHFASANGGPTYPISDGCDRR